MATKSMPTVHFQVQEEDRYQATGHDLLYIERWVDDLLDMNLNELDPPVTGSIEHFKQQAKRYNACFTELVRKTAVVHPDMARLFNKVWRGTGHFVSRLLCDYEFQLSKGGELEDKMKETLEASQIKVFWNGKMAERAKMEFALQRANSIESESALHALREKTRKLEAENDELRSIILHFIEGQGDEDFLIKEGEDMELVRQPLPVVITSPRAKRQTTMAARQTTVAANGHHVRIGSPSAGEGADPQGLPAVTSRSTMAATQRSSTSSGGSRSSGTGSSSNTSEHTKRLTTTTGSNPAEPQTMRKTMTSSTSSQGSVASNSLEQSAVSLETASLNSTDTIMRLDDVGRRTLNLRLLQSEGKAKAESLHIHNDHIDKLLHDIVSEGMKQEHFVTEIDRLLRNDELVTAYAANNLKDKDKQDEAQRGAGPSGAMSPRGPLSIAISSKPNRADVGMQTEAPDVVEVTQATYTADTQSRTGRGAHLPLALRPHMTSFPRSLRIPSLNITTNTIIRILFTKLRSDSQRDQEGLRRLEMPHHVYEFYKQLYGSAAIADVHVVHFVRALQQHRPGHKRVRVFGQLMGTDDVDSPPPFALRDVNFLMEAVRYLEHVGEFGRNKDVLLEQIVLRRQRVMQMAEYLFGGFLPDCGLAFCRRMESMAGPSETQLDFDDVLEEVAGQWMATNARWKGHLAHLFRRYCKTYNVLEEVVFANDAGQVGRDTLLVEVQHERLKRPRSRVLRRLAVRSPENAVPPHNSSNRPKITVGPPSVAKPVASIATNNASLSRPASTAVVLSVEEEASLVESLSDSASQERSDASLFGERSNVTNPGEGDVVELMDKENCRLALRKIDHRLDEAWGLAFFEEACERMLLRTKRQLETMWEVRTGINGAPVYRCASLNITQRTPPYDLSTFRTHDIDLEAFIELAIEYELLAKCPFVRLLDKPSLELWSNRDVYLMQIEEGTILQPAAPSAITATGHPASTTKPQKPSSAAAPAPAPALAPAPRGTYVLDPQLVRRPKYTTS